MRPPGRDVVVAALLAAASVGSPSARAEPPERVAAAGPPRVDPSSIIVEVDAGRVMLRGQHLRGAVLAWRVGALRGEDACAAPEAEPAPGRSDEACAFSVPRDLPADPALIELRVTAPPRPAGDAPGERQPPSPEAAGEGSPLRAARVIVDRVIPVDAAVDVSAGTGRIRLPHPEAVGSVECTDAACDLADDSLIVADEHGGDETLDLRIHLRPRVVLRRGPLLDANPRLSLRLQRCPVSVLSAAPLRGIADQRLVVRVAGRCALDPALDFSIDGAPARLVRTEARAGELLAVLGLTEGPASNDLSVTVHRGATTVGTAHARTRSPPAARAAIELPGVGPIDFIPTNVEARVSLPAFEGAEVVLAPVEGAYTVRRDESARVGYLRGVEGATGSTPLRLAYRDRSLPAPLGALTLAEFVEPLLRPIRVANIPVALAGTGGGGPFAELLCGDGAGHARAVPAGASVSIPYRARDTCRVLLHRERLRVEDGAQAIQLAVQVVASDGSPRSEARLEQRLVVRPGPAPLSIFLRGAVAPFDRILVRLALATDESHYALPPGDGASAQQIQWSVVTGTERFRVYATTSFPTGLFRVSDSAHSGILTLNAGALVRLVALSREGREIPVGIEAGVMWLSIAGDTQASAANHGQVALVAGVGAGVPIANASRAAQTSINLHAWFEYEVSRDLLSQGGSAFGFVFGPSISIGDLGINF